MGDDGGLDDFLDGFYPYRKTSESFRDIPPTGRPRSEVLDLITGFARAEDAMGDDGRVSGSLYSGDHDNYAFLAEVFERFAHANVLQRDMYPSATKFEAEIIAMTARMLHGDPDKGVCGTLTSGGSESLITALYAYREQARAERGVTRPNVVMPVTAHVALDKGAHWMNIEVRHAPLTADFRADVAAMRELADENTICLVGSAGNYPHGLIDPIEEIAALAVDLGIGMHVDGCLGGFLLPWIEQNGRPVPLWDFRVPGVTSISADTHKFAYALKGTSTLIYRSRELRRYQYFTFPDWPGGLYLSPGLAGSRSGGLIAATWAALVTIGQDDYRRFAEEIMVAADTIRAGVDQIDELDVIGDPYFLIAFRSAPEAVDGKPLDIYLVNDSLKESGWRLNSLQLPAALHFCVTRPNTPPGVAEQFVADLRRAVRYAIANHGTPAQSGAMYGFGAGTPQGNATINQIMSGVLDAMHEVAPDA